MTPKLILSAKSVDEVGVSSQKLPSSVPGGEQFPRRLKKKSDESPKDFQKRADESQ
jgi:hypothetical protein